jgi:hypothetical protein
MMLQSTKATEITHIRLVRQETCDIAACLASIRDASWQPTCNCWTAARLGLQNGSLGRHWQPPRTALKTETLSIYTLGISLLR